MLTQEHQEQNVISETLTSLLHLLKTDDELEQSDPEYTVKFYIDSAQGFESIEQLVDSEDEKTKELSKGIIESYLTPYLSESNM